MSKVSDLLTASRTAHQQARTAQRVSDADQSRALFQSALQLRLDARAQDPDRADSAWLEDAQHPAIQGEPERRFHRIPGKTAAQVAAIKDAELEAYFRSQLEDTPEPIAQVFTPEQVSEKVLTPKAWRQTDESTQPCSGHRWQLLAFDRRACACGVIEELVETKALEDTLAYQQLMKEQSA